MFQFEPSDCCCTDPEKYFDPSANASCRVIVNTISVQSIIDRSNNVRAEMLVRHDKIRQFTVVAPAVLSSTFSERKFVAKSVWSAHISSASAVQIHKTATIGIGAENFVIPGNISNSVLDIIKKM